MADSQDDVKSEEITPEDFDGKQEDSKESKSPQAESSPAEEAKEKSEAEKPEGKESEAKPEEGKTEESTEDKESDEAETQEKVEAEDAEKPEDKPDETKPTKADERKQQLNTEIRDLVSKRNSLREEVKKANSEVYQPATAEELAEELNPETGEKYTAVEAKLEAMRQSGEMDKYNERIAEAQLTLHSESERVLTDFPIFNPDSESYDKELAEEAATLLEANLIVDENSKQIIGSNVSPYQLYKTLAKASGISAAKGQIKAQAATEKQLANADSTSSRAPESKPKDPLSELWAEEL